MSQSKQFTPDETDMMARWLMLFCHYMSSQKDAIMASGDFPTLNRIYEEAKPFYHRLRGKAVDLTPDVLIEIDGGKVKEVCVVVDGSPITATHTVFDAADVVTTTEDDDELLRSIIGDV